MTAVCWFISARMHIRITCLFRFAGSGENDSIDEDRVHHGSATLPGGCSLTSSSGGGGGGGAGAKFGVSDEGSECSSVTSESNSGAAPRSHSHTHHSHAKSSSLHSNPGMNVDDCGVGSSGMPPDSLEPLFAELRLRREEVDRLRNKLENVKVSHRIRSDSVSLKRSPSLSC